MDNENKKSPHGIIITAVVLALIAIVGYTGFKLYDKTDSGDVRANNDIAVSQDEQVLGSESQVDTVSDGNQNTVSTSTQNIKTNPNNDTPVMSDETNQVSPTPTTSPTVIPPVINPPIITDPVVKPEPVVPNGFILADFEDSALDNWSENGMIANPGYQSNYAMKLSTTVLDSTAAKMILETPILKGFEKIEFDIKAATNSVLPGDASAFAFEQDGDWKWVSLASYVNSSDNDWQHIAIPLTEFAGLDINKNVSNLTIRLWSVVENDYYFDNIVLTGLTEVDSLERPTNLTGNVVSDHQIDLSWSGTALQYNVYKDNILIATVNESTFSLISLEPSTSYVFYTTATDGINESTPSESIELATSATPTEKLVIADFENGTADGFGDNSVLVSGKDSIYALSLTNPESGAVGIEKNFNNEIAKNHKFLEFDINLSGNYFDDNSATIAFDQNAWLEVSIMPYVDGRSSEWQHVRIPLSDFTGLDTENAIAKIAFRFWNYTPVTVFIDNIVLN